MSSTSQPSTEELMLFNVDDQLGARLRRFLVGDEDVRLELGFGADGTADLRIDGAALPASLTALPTVVETHKSIDGTTFFKAGEIGRVLVTQPPTDTGAPAAAADDLARDARPH